MTVHMGELSTVHTSGHPLNMIYRKNKRAEQKVSIKEECPHRRSVHKGELYCNIKYHEYIARSTKHTTTKVSIHT